jgi:hypothetical protein
VSNRAVLMAVDLQGFQDGENDGPFTGEKLAGKTDMDVLWMFDTMEEVGNFPHNLANSSPVAHGNLMYVSTGNGQDESHVNIPSPKAPSSSRSIARQKLAWEDASPATSPAQAVVDARAQRQRRRPGGADRATGGSGRRSPASCGNSTPTRRTPSGPRRAMKSSARP